LAWRQELSQLFLLLEVALILQSKEMASLEELRHSIFASSDTSLFDTHIGRLLAITGELIEVRELRGEVVLGQLSPDGHLRALTFPELHARSLRFEAALATRTEDLACNRVLERPLLVHQPQKRRLSRQASLAVALPKGATIQEIGDQQKAYNTAKILLSECKKWLAIVDGALRARAILEKLFTKQRKVKVSSLLQKLASKRCNPRQEYPLSSETAAVAIVWLMARTCGGLSMVTSKDSDTHEPDSRDLYCRRDQFQTFQSNTSVTAKDALQKELVALRARERKLSSDIKLALIGMMPRSGEKENTDNEESDETQKVSISSDDE
jgi:hypothetical protein